MAKMALAFLLWDQSLIIAWDGGGGGGGGTENLGLKR